MKNMLIVLCLIVIGIGMQACKGAKKARKTSPTTITPTPTPVNPSETPTPTPTKETETFVAGTTKSVDEPPISLAFKDSLTIRKTQILLFLSGYAPGRVDGKLKEQTLTALTKFQEHNTLPVGDLSEKTLKALGVHLMDFDVQDIQMALDKKGFDPGPIDNLVGNMTRGAYTQFISKNKLDGSALNTELKAALFSNDVKYNNTTAPDALFNPTTTTGTQALPNLVAIDEATIPYVQQALFAQGYDPGPKTTIMTPQLKDALFKYQVDRKLPVGGLNEETLQALGFR
jgi:peptidoglycan hydrolase-like protein with peptidoglycan-binding domain